MTAGVRNRFDRELMELGEILLDLGSRARQEVARGIEAYVRNDADLAREVIGADTEINRLRYRIEEQCYALLALEQPVAGDLRTVVAALISAIEFERMADHGKKLARICLRTAAEPRAVPTDDIVRLGGLVLEMVDRVLKAIAGRDIAEARAVCQADDQVDAAYKQLFNIKLSYMLEDVRAIGPGTYQIQVAHELERVGDRVTNLAERLIYAVTGEMIDLNT